jgi:hypothetical protein
MAGAYQRLSLAAVQHLKGASWHLWLRVLTHPMAPRLTGEASFELAITGHQPSLPLELLGLDRLNRPSKVRTALERAARRGGDLGLPYQIEVVDRASGGLKLRVTRAPQGVDAALLGRRRGTGGTSSRQLVDASLKPDAGQDGFLDMNQDTNRESANEARELGWVCGAPRPARCLPPPSQRPLHA